MAILRPSQSAQWLRCPASLQFPAGDATPEQEEGKRLHSIMADCLQGGHIPIGADERLIGFCLREVRKLAGDADLKIEQTVKMHYGGEGTPDLFFEADKKLFIVDFKFGAGVKVTARNNTQLILYALACKTQEHTGVELVIIQPKLDSVDSFFMSVESLDAWARTFDLNIRQAQDGLKIYNPSENACRFCNGKTICKARVKKMLDVTLPHDPVITAKNIGQLLTQVKKIQSWIKSLEEEARKILEQGGEVEGWTLDYGSGIRMWTDEDAALKALQQAGYDVLQPASIAEIERRIGKAEFARICSKFYTKKQVTKLKKAGGNNEKDGNE